MTTERLQEWLDAYLAAWHSYDPEQIGALFTEDASYAYSPWENPLQGRQAIVDSWLDDRDSPGSWEATYEPLLVAGDRAVATGETAYASGNTYSNMFVMRFEDGRCSEFVEWYMKHPASG